MCAQCDYPVLLYTWLCTSTFLGNSRRTEVLKSCHKLRKIYASYKIFVGVVSGGETRMVPRVANPSPLFLSMLLATAFLILLLAKEAVEEL